jgi:hypothetical protein
MEIDLFHKLKRAKIFIKKYEIVQKYSIVILHESYTGMYFLSGFIKALMVLLFRIFPCVLRQSGRQWCMRNCKIWLVADEKASFYENH